MEKLSPLFVFLLSSTTLFLSVAAECECDTGEDGHRDKPEALRLKIAAIASILAAGALGVCLPVLGKYVPALRPENDVFFVIKAFAAGVILATGMIHILPDAFDNLTSPCLKENPWGKFPFAGFVAMLSAIGTLMVDAFATGYYKRARGGGGGGLPEKLAPADMEVAVHTHGTHGHAHGSMVGGDDLIRLRVISEVSIILLLQ